jgi:hypothetical protein
VCRRRGRQGHDRSTSAMKSRTRGGSLNLAADFRRHSLPCTTPEKFFQNRRTSLPRAGVPATARSLGPRRRRRQVGAEIDGDPAGLAPSHWPTATARSAHRRGSLVGMDVVVGVEAGKSERRRGGQGGHALECGQVRAARVVPPPVGTLI